MDSSETIDFVNLSSRNFMATHQPLSEFTSHYQAIRPTSPSTTLPTSSHHSTHTQTHHVLVPTPTPLELAVHPTVIPDISTSSLVNKVHLPHIPTPLQDDQNQQPAQIQQPTQIQELIQQEKEEQERVRQLNTDKMNQLLQQQLRLAMNTLSFHKTIITRKPYDAMLKRGKYPHPEQADYGTLEVTPLPRCRLI